MATVSEDRNQLVFASGEVWTRVGAVGELAVPKPGEMATDVELGGNAHRRGSMMVTVSDFLRILSCWSQELRLGGG